MEGVIEQSWLFLVCHSDHHALVAVNHLQPFTLPGFKFWKICLKGLTICLVLNGKIHYGVIGEEPDITLYHVPHIIYIQKEQTGSQHRTLWHTGHDRAGVRRLAFKHNSLGSVWKKGSNPGDNIIIYAKTMELQQEPFVIYLIKGLADVHYNNVSLTTFIRCVRDVLYKLNWLGFTTEFFCGNHVGLNEGVDVCIDRPWCLRLWHAPWPYNRYMWVILGGSSPPSFLHPFRKLD